MKEEKLKITLEINEVQAQVIQSALDLYSRLGIGQVEEMSTNFGIFGDQLMKLTEDDRDKIKTLNKEFKQILFPNLDGNSYYGIYSDKVPKNSKISYDIIQVMRNKIAFSKNPKGGHTTDFGTPIKSSHETEFIKCYVEKT